MSFPNLEFGKIRAFFWPVHRSELSKLIPMLLMAFFVCFNYSVLRNLKDVLVVTAKSSGAEALPFIKVWVLLPTAVFFTLIFTKLSNKYSQERVFYYVISFFLLFFAVFTFIIFPYQDYVHPHLLADHLETVLPSGFKGLIAMFRNWSFTLFYVVSELWGSMVLSVLFWGFANEVTHMKEARRFYSLIGVVSSVAAVIAGEGANYFTSGLNWESTLNTEIAIVLIFGALTMVAFRWMNKKVLNKPEFDALHKARWEVKPKKKLSITESFSYLSNSKYLICIAVLVVCYNLVINLIEIVWKDQLLQLYPLKKDYNSYMNSMTTCVGIFATLTSLFMAKLISGFGWTRTALITPMIMLTTSAGFFGFMIFRNDLADLVNLPFEMAPLHIAVLFGAAQVCLSKACKYSVFDSTKEMAFIPLSHECKLKGKAAIDGVGSRLGKSGGSVVHQGLLMILGTVSASAPYVAIIMIAVIVGWSIAVRSLGKQFAGLIGEQERADIGETETQIDPEPSPNLQPAESV